MKSQSYSHQDLVRIAKFTQDDFARILKCRQDHYWQAKEISRVMQECDPRGANIGFSLLEHISPIGWENVILYGEYVLNRSLVRS